MKNGLTLNEEAFCQLVATGKTGVDAYAEAFGKPIVDDERRRNYTKRASNLAKRPDVASRILEAKGEQKRRDREKWQMRGDEIAEAMFGAIQGAMGAFTDKGKPCILQPETLKGIEVLAKLKGLNEPDTTVLKNGGMTDDAMPRGLKDVSDKDLDAIIARGETIDVEEGETMDVGMDADAQNEEAKQ